MVFPTYATYIPYIHIRRMYRPTDLANPRHCAQRRQLAIIIISSSIHHQFLPLRGTGGLLGEAHTPPFPFTPTTLHCPTHRHQVLPLLRDVGGLSVEVHSTTGKQHATRIVHGLQSIDKVGPWGEKEGRSSIRPTCPNMHCASTPPHVGGCHSVCGRRWDCVRGTAGERQEGCAPEAAEQSWGGSARLPALIQSGASSSRTYHPCTQPHSPANASQPPPWLPPSLPTRPSIALPLASPD